MTQEIFAQLMEYHQHRWSWWADNHCVSVRSSFSSTSLRVFTGPSMFLSAWYFVEGFEEGYRAVTSD